MVTHLGQSSKSLTVEWGTPQWLFDMLDEDWGFTLDPCASDHNHKCSKYYTERENGLLQSWAGETVFCNPPYGKELPKWVKKCHDEWIKHNIDVVMLIPARTDTKYFHQYIYHKAELQFLQGRLKFSNPVAKENGAAPFPSMIAIFHKRLGE